MASYLDREFWAADVLSITKLTRCEQRGRRTPTVPGAVLNKGISFARAFEVRVFLRQFGLPQSVPVFVRAIGSRDPIESNATVAGRQRNRRVEFWVCRQP